LAMEGKLFDSFSCDWSFWKFISFSKGTWLVSCVPPYWCFIKCNISNGGMHWTLNEFFKEYFQPIFQMNWTKLKSLLIHNIFIQVIILHLKKDHNINSILIKSKKYIHV
jgi:hypothetical protein